MNENLPFPQYEPEDHNFLDINIKVMHYFGLWNYHWKNKKIWRYWAYFAYSIVTIMINVLHTLTMILELIFNSNLSDFAPIALIGNNFFATAIKQIFIFAQTDAIQDNIMKMRGGVLSKRLRWCKEQDDILRRANKTTRNLSMVYYGVGVCAIVCFLAIALRTSYYKVFMEFSGAVNYTRQHGEMQLPSRAWFPFDIQEPTNYLIAFVFQLSIFIIGPGVNIGSDTLIAGLLIHICGEFRVLKHSLRTMKRRALQLLEEQRNVSIRNSDNSISRKGKTEDSDLTILHLKHEDLCDGNDDMIEYGYTKEDLDSKMYEAFKECIRHHQEILKFVYEMEEEFSAMMFVQFLSISLRLCLNIYTIITSEDEMQTITYTQMLFVTFQQGLLYCWFGSELTWQSENVSRVMYETPWVEGTLKFRRSVLIMTMRAQRLVQLTGGKIYTMSLDTFQAMVYASFSFFRLLQEFGTSQ